MYWPNLLQIDDTCEPTKSSNDLFLPMESIDAGDKPRESMSCSWMSQPVDEPTRPIDSSGSMYWTHVNLNGFHREGKFGVQRVCFQISLVHNSS